MRAVLTLPFPTGAANADASCPRPTWPPPSARSTPHSTIRAASIRIVRLATNAFLSSADLVLRTMAEFAPDPDEPEITDAELEAAAEEARRAGGGMKGIELRGGVGAGGGEEVK